MSDSHVLRSKTAELRSTGALKRRIEDGEVRNGCILLLELIDRLDNLLPANFWILCGMCPVKTGIDW